MCWRTYTGMGTFCLRKRAPQDSFPARGLFRNEQGRFKRQYRGESVLSDMWESTFFSRSYIALSITEVGPYGLHFV